MTNLENCIPSFKRLSDFVDYNVVKNSYTYPLLFVHPVNTNDGILVYEDHTSKPFHLIRNNDDEIEDLKPMKILARCNDEYLKVGKHYFHRFVAECVLDRELKKGEVVDHIEPKPMNNNVYNLQVISCSENIKKVERTNYHCFVLDDRGKILKECFTLTEIVLFTGVSGPTVKLLLTGKVLGLAVNDEGKRFRFKSFQVI